MTTILAPSLRAEALPSKHTRSAFGIQDELKETLLYNTSDLDYFHGFVTAEQLFEYKASDEIPRFIYFQAIIESYGGIDQAFEAIFSSLVKDIHTKFPSPMYPAFLFFYLYTKGVYIPSYLHNPITSQDRNEKALAYFEEKYSRLRDFLIEKGARFTHSTTRFTCDDITAIQEAVASIGLTTILDDESLDKNIIQHGVCILDYVLYSAGEFGKNNDDGTHSYGVLEYLFKEKEAAAQQYDSRATHPHYDKQKFLSLLLDEFLDRSDIRNRGRIHNGRLYSFVLVFFQNGIHHLVQHIKKGGSMDDALDQHAQQRTRTLEKIVSAPGMSEEIYPGLTDALKNFHRPLESPAEKMVFFNTRLEDFLRGKREDYQKLLTQEN